MNEHSINKLNNFIAGWYFNDLKICDDLMEYHSNSNQKASGSIFRNGKKTIDESIKKSIDITLNIKDKIFQDYLNNLIDVTKEYIKKYPYCNEYQSWGINDAVNIQHYEPNGGYYTWHTERGSKNEPQSSRHLVFITYLNDVTDDGETEFLHQKIKIKPQKGLTVIFPADWTFTHRGIPSKTQEKYIVTGWFNFFD